MSLKTFLFVCLLVAAGGSIAWADQDQKDGDDVEKSQARYTPLVKLVERCLPAVASLQTVQAQDSAGVFTMGVGSASLIHEEGRANLPTLSFLNLSGFRLGATLRRGY